MGGWGRAIVAGTAAAALAMAAPASAFDPVREQHNFAKVGERCSHEQCDPEYQVAQSRSDVDNLIEILGRDLNEGDRFSGSLCGSGILTCNGDTRVYDWAGSKGLQLPIVYINRNGAHIEGHIWISKRSLQGAATVARRQAARRRAKARRRRASARRCLRARRRVTRAPAFTGRASCRRRARAKSRARVRARQRARARARRRRAAQRRRQVAESSRLRLPGVVLETGSIQAPERWYYWAAQVLAAHGYVVMTFDVQGQGRSDALGTGPEAFQGFPAQDLGHFVADLDDAIDFFVSSDRAQYKPGSPEAAALQRSEVAAKDATAFNPLHLLVDTSRIGIVGHSLGASAVSVVQEHNPRVDAAVAWDNLSSSVKPRVPSLGMSADYGIAPTPKAGDPDPGEKDGGFRRWRGAGVDSMQVNVRGGTHFEWSYSPNPMLPASFRGIDMAAWYTTAWLDKYVKADPTADRRLLTNRFDRDPGDLKADPGEQGNLFSFYYRSPFTITRNGVKIGCEDMRIGCGHLSSDDGEPKDPPYRFRNDRG